MPDKPTDHVNYVLEGHFIKRIFIKTFQLSFFEGTKNSHLLHIVSYGQADISKYSESMLLNNRLKHKITIRKGFYPTGS